MRAHHCDLIMILTRYVTEMKKKQSPTANIKLPEIVTRYRDEADRVEMSADAMLALVDFIMAFQEDRPLPS